MQKKRMVKRFISCVMALVLVLTGIGIVPQEVSANEYSESDKIIINNINIGDIFSTGTTINTANKIRLIYNISYMGESSYTFNYDPQQYGQKCYIGKFSEGMNTWSTITDQYKKWKIVDKVTSNEPYTFIFDPVLNSTVTFVDSINTGKATGMPETQDVEADARVTKPATNPTRSGYRFKGWYTDSGCHKEFDFGQTIAAGQTISIYAGWSPNQYTVTFNPDGGECETRSQTVTYGQTYFSLPTASKTGYKFGGWFLNKESGNAITNTTKVAMAENHTLYAKWIPNTYTISFNANGGSGTMSEMSMNYGISKNLSENTFTKENCRLVEWNTKADGSGMAYADKAEVNNLMTNDGGTVTLYAIWADKYILTRENASKMMSFDISTRVYNGDVQDISVIPRSEYDLGSITVKYYDEDNQEVAKDNLKNAGTYTVKINVTEGKDNKKVSDLEIGTFTIEKRKITIKADDKESVYGGAIQTFTASVTGDSQLVKPDDLGTISATCNITAASNAGEYIIVPTYIENPNYDVTIVKGKYTIKKKEQSTPANLRLTGVSYYNGLKDTGDGRITGVTDRMEYRKEGGTAYTTIPSGATTIEGLSSGTYYVRYKESANEQASQEVAVIITKNTEDVTAPDITILQGENKLNKILNKITFGLFFKGATLFDILATDIGAGVNQEKYAYYLDENPDESPKSVQEIGHLAWTTGSQVCVESGKRFVLYVKAEDKLGNVSYAYTDGIQVVKINGSATVRNVTELQTVIEQGFEKIEIDMNMVIPENMKVTIPAGTRITILNGVELNNKGIINGAGTICNEGSLTNNASIGGMVTVINNGVLINNGVIDTTGFVANAENARNSGSGSSSADNALSIKYDTTTKKNAVSGNTVVQLGDGTVTMEIKAGMQMKDFVISPLENIINGCLTDVEKTAVENGQNIKIRVTLKALESNASVGEQAAIKSAFKALEKDGCAVNIANYFDVSFEKKLGVEAWTKITNLSNDINITLNIPSEYQKDGRKFYVVRNHDGKCDILSDIDNEAGTVTFTTDRFSTYALGYTEAAKNASKNISKSINDKGAQTGDDCNVFVWMALLFMSMAGLMASLYMRKKEQY